jgi:hypothetical protein
LPTPFPTPFSDPKLTQMRVHVYMECNDLMTQAKQNDNKRRRRGKKKRKKKRD